eukprot:TRINITY_DN44865_c0_g1_i2.p1 TRINITY_DN44865_c0_g1~~TRINITY_DN44865_c0_g1_i2.p1  ORF type:complete len:823 (+),score=291.39 TRINITY_DN44865_c0_g1_i2:68-2536(+)
MSSDKQYFDPMFEFDAPQGIDLAVDHDDSATDKWFDPAPKASEAVVDPLDSAFEATYAAATALLRDSEVEAILEEKVVVEEAVTEQAVTEEPVVEPEVVETMVEAVTEEPAVEARIPSPETEMTNPAACSFSISEWKKTEVAVVEEAAPKEAEPSMADQYQKEKQRIMELQRQTMVESQTPEARVAQKEASPKEIVQKASTPEPIVQKAPTPVVVAEAPVTAPAVESPMRPQRLIEEQSGSAAEDSPVQAFWNKAQKPGHSPNKRKSGALSSRLLAGTASSASKKSNKTPQSSATKSAKRSRRSESVTPMKLTVPSSPKFSAGRRSKKVAAPVKTREELEMEQAQSEVQRLKEQRQRRHKNYQQSKADSRSGTASQARSTKALTQPKEFSFRVDTRPGALATKEPPSEVSLAEQVRKFQKDTPVRFRTVSKTAAARGPGPQVKVDALKLTQPDSPKFSSNARARPSNLMSTEEQELAMMAEFQAKPFKANPVNKAIFEAHGTTGVKTVAKKSLTVPEEPKFRVNERAAMRPVAEAQDESPPKKQKLASAGPTVPVSPKLSTDARAAFSKHKAEAPEEVKPVAFKAAPMPEFANVFVPVISTHKLTEPQPFQFAGDKFHEKAQREFEEKKKQQEEEDALSRVFKANPIKEYQFTGGTGAVAPQLTEIKPFNLHSETRHAEYERKLAAERNQEEHEAELARVFKASEPTVLTKSPFVPKKSNKPLTEISNFELSTDSRADKREAFDMQIQKKLEESDRLKREQELRQLEEDKAAIQELRKTQMSFKANPVRYAAVPMTARPSEKSLTNPYSPALMTKSRAAMQK